MRPLLATACLSALFAASLQSQSANLPLKRTPTPTTAEISARDLMTRTYIIADDSMEGRETGKRGGLKSATYIAGELKRLGLEPAGDNGTYFQAIPWITRSPDTTSSLTVGGTSLKWGTDFIVMPKLGFALALGGQPFGAGFDGSGVPTIYGGRIGDSTIAPADARGKVVVFAPAASSPNFNFFLKDDLRRFADAKAIVVATLDLGAAPTLKRPRDTYWDVNAPGAARPLTVISITMASGERIFSKPMSELSLGASGSPISGRATFAEHPTEAPAYNVVAILRGGDPKLRSSYVAVGAHHDHVGFSPPVDHDSIRAFNRVVRQKGLDDPQPRSVTDAQWAEIKSKLDSLHRLHGVRLDSINNGADDDGSGSVLALEIAESFAKSAQKPKRSLLFVWHTAEEKGLFGAQYFSDHPTVPRDSIVAQINMDQMGRGEPVDNPPGGANALVLIGSRRLSTELGDLAEKVNNSNKDFGFHFDYAFDKNGDPTNGYCRSDHYMYARYGIPVVFYSAAAWHIDYHMVSDEPQYIAYDRSARIGRYIREMIAATANLDHRPVIDKPKPNPDAVCKQ